MTTVGAPRKPKIPRLISEADITSLPLGPTEGFVLSRIDGSASVDEIADMTGLGTEAVNEIVVRLIEADVAEWVEPIHPRTRHSVPRITPPRGTMRTKPAPPNTTRLLYDPQELEEPNVDLDVDRRHEILDTYYRLDELSFYELLNVPEDADKKDIRTAYFTLSKRFHPDTLFGKRLGSYKTKMEVIFKRLTEIYDILGKGRQRAEYDAYLKLRKRTMATQKTLDEGHREAERIEKETTRAVGRAIVEPEPAPVEKPPPSEPPPQREMSEEAKKRSKELLAKKLAAATGRRVPGSPPPPRRTPPPATPERVAEPADRDTLLRGLASSLKNVAAVTGGIDRAKKHLEDARAAEAEGNLVSAANSLRLATALTPERKDLQAEYERVTKALSTSLADTYEKQGQYEERMNRWAEAALSWSKVCEGRPDDAHAHRRTAAAMLEAGGDLAKAKQYAQRAVELLPEDARTRRTLGRVFFAAGMTLNAKRELEKSAKLDPSDEMVKNLLRELSQKKK